MKEAKLVFVVQAIAAGAAWAATATFTPVGPTSVPAGTDVQMTLTVTVQTLSGFNTADILIGSTDATNLLFAYSGQWLAAFDNVRPPTPDIFGYYPQEIYVGGNNPSSVGTSLLVGTLTIKTSGMTVGSHVVTISYTVDQGVSQLGLAGQGDPLFGTGTFTIIACTGDVQACCGSNGTCALIETDCCLAQSGTPQGFGATCQGDADNDGVDELCGDSCTGFPNVDSDGDGLCDSSDLCFGFPNVDGDDDEVCDGEDNCPTVSNPIQSDSDGDGVGNHCDNCLFVPNGDQRNCDGDGVGDACEAAAERDDDLDGICNGVDNCPAAINVGQADGDGDGRGDACDPCPNDNPDDTDGDGACNSADPCAGFPNIDTDGDAVCDSGDPCTGFPNVDADTDGICNSGDLCAGLPNVDADGDGLCDSADPCGGFPNVDTDSDGVCDSADLCPQDNPDDTDGDGLCDVDDRCAGADDTLDTNGNGTPDCLEFGIPTVSTWGLVVLALLLLTGAKLSRGSRPGVV